VIERHKSRNLSRQTLFLVHCRHPARFHGHFAVFGRGNQLN
jgi:hypothetical protein